MPKDEVSSRQVTPHYTGPSYCVTEENTHTTLNSSKIVVAQSSTRFGEWLLKTNCSYCQTYQMLQGQHRRARHKVDWESWWVTDIMTRVLAEWLLQATKPAKCQNINWSASIQWMDGGTTIQILLYFDTKWVLQIYHTCSAIYVPYIYMTIYGQR